MFRYEGQKDDEGKSSKVEFDYKKTAIELAALYFIVYVFSLTARNEHWQL